MKIQVAPPQRGQETTEKIEPKQETKSDTASTAQKPAEFVNTPV